MNVNEKDPPWFAVQVRTRSEKLVSSILENKDFENLLPLYSIDRQRSDRVLGIELPLLPSYLFCRLDLSSRLLPRRARHHRGGPLAASIADAANRPPGSHRAVRPVGSVAVNA